jgi:hypothetical protein
MRYSFSFKNLDKKNIENEIKTHSCNVDTLRLVTDSMSINIRYKSISKVAEKIENLLNIAETEDNEKVDIEFYHGIAANLVLKV